MRGEWHVPALRKSAQIVVELRGNLYLCLFKFENTLD